MQRSHLYSRSRALTGAWIETVLTYGHQYGPYGRALTGAWIETAECGDPALAS